jgi:hypothetical protein
MVMSSATTAPLRRAIERLIPERPFSIEFWDGTGVPATEDGGPVFSVRSHGLATQDLDAFAERALDLLLALHEGSLSRYRLRPSEFLSWKARYDALANAG